LAQSGHFTAEFQCPLLGVKRTLAELPPMSAFDPKRTSSGSGLLLCKLSPKSQFRRSQVLGVTAPFQVRGRKASFNGKVSPSFTDASMTPSEVVGLLRMSNGPLALNERGPRAY
jgi:hypothetical protein